MQAPSNSVPEIYSNAMLGLMKWHERLDQELKARNWGAPDLARTMGRAGDKALIELIYKWRSGEVENPRGTAMADIAKALDMTELELRGALTTPKNVPWRRCNSTPECSHKRHSL